MWAFIQVKLWCWCEIATMVAVRINYKLMLNFFTDLIDNSGIEFFYTSTRRQHDAGILTVGHTVRSSMIIPPNTESYSIVGECSDDCTRTVQNSFWMHVATEIATWLRGINAIQLLGVCMRRVSLMHETPIIGVVNDWGEKHVEAWMRTYFWEVCRH